MNSSLLADWRGRVILKESRVPALRKVQRSKLVQRYGNAIVNVYGCAEYAP